MLVVRTSLKDNLKHCKAQSYKDIEFELIHTNYHETNEEVTTYNTEDLDTCVQFYFEQAL